MFITLLGDIQRFQVNVVLLRLSRVWDFNHWNTQIHADTQPSVFSLEWQHTNVVQPVGCLMPLCLHSTDWLSDCLSVSVCCFLSVWLQGWSHVQEWAPPLPRWQAWPQWVNVHYHMKTKCQAAPLPTTAICLSLWVSVPGHLHSNTNTLTCYYLCTHKYAPQEGSDT